jgi:hypothetical protein
MLVELVPLLRRHGEFDLDDDSAALLVGMSAATIDRKLADASSRSHRSAEGARDSNPRARC